MRQGNGTDLFGENDPRGLTTGIIYVAPNDDRQSVLAAILTQEKLGRKQVVLVLPDPNKAFQRPVDFDGLKNMRRKLQAQLIVVAPDGAGPAMFARQRRFPVFSSLDSYKQSLGEPPSPASGKRGWRPGRKLIPPTPPISSVSPGVPESSSEDELLPPGTLGTPANQYEKRTTQPLPAPNTAKPNIIPSDYTANENDVIPPVSDQEEISDLYDPLNDPLMDDDLKMRHLFPQIEDESDDLPPLIKKEHDRQVVYIAPEEDLTGVRDRLEQTMAHHITLVIPSQSSLRSNVSWRVLHNRVRELGKDVLVVCAAAQIRDAARQAGFHVANALDTTSSSSQGPLLDEENAHVVTFPIPIPEPTSQPQPTPEPEDAPNAPTPVRPLASPVWGTPPSTPLRRAAPVPPPHRRQGVPPTRAVTARRPPRRRRGRAIAWLLLALLVILASLYVAVNLNVFPGLIPSATITLRPDSSLFQRAYAIRAVTGVPDLAQHEVQARLLAYTSASQTKTVKATGVGTIAATQARGELTFYNLLSSPQTLAAGTILTDTSGVRIVNDSAVTIPGAKLPLAGSAGVASHSINAGSSNNIAAFDFNDVPCCLPGLTVQNTAAFSGGQDASSYAFVQQADIDAAMATIRTPLEQNTQAVLHSQIAANEALLNPFRCVPDSTVDHHAGDRATNVTITLTETCSGEVYDQQGAKTLAANLLKTDSSHVQGIHYVLSGQVATAVTRVTTVDAKGTIALLVNANGRRTYQLSNDDKRALAQAILGETPQSAGSFLQAAAGTKNVDIELSWLNWHTLSNTLPTDTSQIVINVADKP